MSSNSHFSFVIGSTEEGFLPFLTDTTKLQASKNYVDRGISILADLKKKKDETTSGNI